MVRVDVVLQPALVEQLRFVVEILGHDREGQISHGVVVAGHLIFVPSASDLIEVAHPEAPQSLVFLDGAVVWFAIFGRAELAQDGFLVVEVGFAGRAGRRMPGRLGMEMHDVLGLEVCPAEGILFAGGRDQDLELPHLADGTDGTSREGADVILEICLLCHVSCPSGFDSFPSRTECQSIFFRFFLHRAPFLLSTQPGQRTDGEPGPEEDGHGVTWGGRGCTMSVPGAPGA